MWNPASILFSVHQGLFPRSSLTQSQSNFKPAFLRSAQGLFTYKWLFKVKAHNNVVPRKTVNYCFVKYHPSRCGSQNGYIQGGFLSVQLTSCLTCFSIHDATERKYLTILSNLKLCSTHGKSIDIYGRKQKCFVEGTCSSANFSTANFTETDLESKQILCKKRSTTNREVCFSTVSVLYNPPFRQ